MLDNNEEEEDMIPDFAANYGAFFDDTAMGEPEKDTEGHVVEDDLGQMLREAETWITNHHNDTFATWLQKEVMNNDEIHEQLAWLARGPANSILMYQGYEINGYTIYTRAQDNKSTNQNSGVRIDATDSSGKKNSYFGYIEEI